jgi:hypothetical protein
MMGFLRWICETYIMPKLKKGKRGKRKSVNQYWRDFKMLYRRVNGFFVNANDSHEVVKVSLDSCYYTLFYYSRYSADLTLKSSLTVNSRLTMTWIICRSPNHWRGWTHCSSS